jgi:hypothetical protein
MKRTLLIAAALTLAPLATASAQQGKEQTRVPARATREASELQARRPAPPSLARVTGSRVVTVEGVRKQPKSRPAPRN